MSVTSIYEGRAAIAFKDTTSVISTVQQASGPSLSIGKDSIEAAQPIATVSGTTNKITPALKQYAHANVKQYINIGRMSHVVEMYNPQGKKRLQFMDSNNNVIYQSPSEMTDKIKELMMNSDTSVIKKG